MIKDLRPLEKWNVSKGETFELMFADLVLVTDVSPLKNWKVADANVEQMFRGLKSLTNKYVLKGWPVNFEYMFHN